MGYWSFGVYILNLLSISLHKRSIPSFLDWEMSLSNKFDCKLLYQVLIMLFLSVQILSNEKKTLISQSNTKESNCRKYLTVLNCSICKVVQPFSIYVWYKSNLIRKTAFNMGIRIWPYETLSTTKEYLNIWLQISWRRILTWIMESCCSSRVSQKSMAFNCTFCAKLFLD